MRVLSMIYITALMQEAAIGLPPFVPVTVIYGTFDRAINKSFNSAAPTKPTGVPMIAAGRIYSHSLNITSNKAVGALPIATIAPSNSLPK